MKYYICNTCGNIVVLFEDAGVIPSCCNNTMEEIVCKTKDEMKEKHVPVVDIKDREVVIKVGEILHPMKEDHYIKWIVLETDKGKYIRSLKPGQEPIVKFWIDKDEIPKYVYAYCNLHSLWEKKL